MKKHSRHREKGHCLYPSFFLQMIAGDSHLEGATIRILWSVLQTSGGTPLLQTTLSWWCGGSVVNQKIVCRSSFLGVGDILFQVVLFLSWLHKGNHKTLFLMNLAKPILDSLVLEYTVWCPRIAAFLCESRLPRVVFSNEIWCLAVPVTAGVIMAIKTSGVRVRICCCNSS